MINKETLFQSYKKSCRNNLLKHLKKTSQKDFKQINTSQPFSKNCLKIKYFYQNDKNKFIFFIKIYKSYQFLKT